MPSDFEQINRIQVLARMGQVEAALQKLRQLILSAGDDLNLWTLYAEIAVDAEDVRYGLQQILRLNPTDRSAAARLEQLGGPLDQPPPAIPESALSLSVEDADDGGEQPTARLSRKMMRKLGLRPGDLAQLHGPDGQAMPVVVAEGGENGESLALNAQARRFLDVRRGGEVAIVPPECLVLLMDCSTSMRLPLKIGVSRMKGTKRAIKMLLEAKTNQGDDRVALVTFASFSQVLVHPTKDYARVGKAAREMRPNGATAMLEGMSKSIELLRGQDGAKRIILLTDGSATSSGPREILSMAKTARDAKIIIDTIGLGKPGQHDYNERLLRSIAEITGGRFRYVDDLETLEQTFTKLASEKRLLLTD